MIKKTVLNKSIAAPEESHAEHFSMAMELNPRETDGVTRNTDE